MITIEMVIAAIGSLVGLSALIVTLTQIFKNWASNAEWYKKAREAGKNWPGHMFGFISSFICCGLVLLVGLLFNTGIFAGFCVSCFASWAYFVILAVGFGGMSNGWWTYEFVQKFLQWISLMPKPNMEQEPNTNYKN